MIPNLNYALYQLGFGGAIMFLQFFLMTAHKFFIGLRSGELPDYTKTLKLHFSKKFCIIFDV